MAINPWWNCFSYLCHCQCSKIRWIFEKFNFESCTVPGVPIVSEGTVGRANFDLYDVCIGDLEWNISLVICEVFRPYIVFQKHLRHVFGYCFFGGYFNTRFSVACFFRFSDQKTASTLWNPPNDVTKPSTILYPWINC